MPPKAAAPVANEAFLAVCVKCAKSKLDVDFDLVAKATGMSKGGAKYEPTQPTHSSVQQG